MSRQKEFQAPAPKAYHSISNQILLECLLYPGLCWARGWLLLSERKRAQEGWMRREESRTAGRSESIQATLMRNPRARIVRGGVAPLHSGPELDFRPSSLMALDMVGEGGKNMIWQSRGWSRHSVPSFPEASLNPLNRPPPPCLAGPSSPMAQRLGSLHSSKGLSKCLQMCFSS